MESTMLILHCGRPYGTDSSRQRQDHARRPSCYTAIEGFQELDVLPAIMSVAAAANKIRNAAEISCLIGSGPSTPTPAPRPMPLSKRWVASEPMRLAARYRGCGNRVKAWFAAMHESDSLIGQAYRCAGVWGLRKLRPPPEVSLCL